MENGILIRSLRKAETGKALRLVKIVFLEFEAPDYTEEGIREFFIGLRKYKSRFRCFYFP